MQSKLPKYTLGFLRWFCRSEYLEEIEGDLSEVFEREAAITPTKAKWKFRWRVLKYFRPAFIEAFNTNNQFNPTIMVKHNFLLTYRSFKRYKMTFVINLGGLSIGLACAFLIFMWVNDEVKVDRFFENDQRLYQFMEHQTNADGILTTPATPGLMADAMTLELPEIEYAATSTPPDYFDLKVGDNLISSVGQYVTPNYFNVFSYPFLDGDQNDPLSNSNSIVITESMAVRLFNSAENVVGKTILIDNGSEYTISAVLEDIPSNASVQFDFLLSIEVYKTIAPGAIDWTNNNMLTYAMMREGIDIESFNEKIKDFVVTHGGEEHVSLFSTLYRDRYLYGNYENGVQSGGRIEYVNLFSVIAVFILGIACINFMNLSTAQASRKAKEIGVKKAIGSGRGQLIWQYLTESQIVVFLSLIVALGMIVLLLPKFNSITGKNIDLVVEPMYLIAILCVSVFTGLLAGSYPAFFLSAFKPIDVLKGKIVRSKWEKWAPKGLVVVQFSLSVILIVSVFTIYKQIDFIQNKNLGYDRDNIVQFSNIGSSPEQVETYLSEIQKMPGVIGASNIGHRLVGDYYSSTSTAQWEGQQVGEVIEVEIVPVNFGMLELLDIEVVEGRSFERDKSDNISKVILNQRAIETMGLENPIGKFVKFWGQDMEIIGVAKNFHVRTLHEQIIPQFFLLGVEYAWLTMAKVEGGREQEFIQALEEFSAEVNPEASLEYTFLDDNFNAQYVAEQRVSLLSRYFSGIAILISCLGLFGLAAFTAQRRRKEIGIRKVLGSGSFDIVRLLTSDFTKTVIAAIIIGLPVSYFLMTEWLKGYAFHIQLEWWYFASAGLLAMLVAWFTVSLQTIKAARVNPTHCLKEE